MITPKEAEKYLKETVIDVTNIPMRRSCQKVLEDERFLESPAAKKRHHAHKGGLVVHTAQVMDVALAMASADIEVSINVIITSIIWHDFGKIYNYSVSTMTPLPDEVITGTRHLELIDHLPRSYAEFLRTADYFGVDEDKKLAVSHCILAHHGRYEWRSPILPQTLEAFIIHCADMVSSQYQKNNQDKI